MSNGNGPYWPEAWKDLRVGVIGGGKSGLAAARLLHRLGADVLLSDEGKIRANLPRGIKKEEGHSAKLLSCKLLVRSPGVPNELGILQKARQRRIPIWSELELAYRQARPKRVVAITGTNGKTTTTNLVGELFKRAGVPTEVGGNIGTPLSDLLPRVTAKTTVVLEVSSYQLENIETFHPQISVILNITPDHLEHHGTMARYAQAKARIFERQGAADVLIVNYDDVICRKMSKQASSQLFYFSRKNVLSAGIWYRDGRLNVRWKGQKWSAPLVWRLPGDHNIENALAAVAVAVAGRIPRSEILETLKAFKGVEHRLEFVRSLGGVRYINDSKGTNVDSTRVALASFSDPLIVIMGGEGKGSPYAPLKALIRRHVRQLLLIGEDAPTIHRELGDLVPTFLMKTMDKAVSAARKMALPGEVVLLSPACASFDQYTNYEERGRHFKSLVRRLR